MQPFPGALHWTPIVWLQLVERELLLFALVWFLIGMIDEMVIDAIWFALRLAGRAITRRLSPAEAPRYAGDLEGPAAVLIPAWHEAEVIGVTIAHTLRAWPQRALRLYIGCYRNDPATLAAAMQASGGDSRLRLVIVDRDGPTTKADCLNRLYAALRVDEAKAGRRYRSVILQDAEDMVHPLALGLIDKGLGHADFVQLPVRPELPAGSRWVAGHYADEFTEDHTKTLVVRDALGAALPAAGVGCGFARDMFDRIAMLRRDAGGAGSGEGGPFAAECLTEDYEFGMLVARAGGRGRFLRLRDAEGQLIATRAYFPATLPTAVRQKTRWIHGIALQGWDRLGWAGSGLDVWMALRDRRGPMASLVLGAAYILLCIELTLLSMQAGHDPRSWAGSWTGLAASLPLSPAVGISLRICAVGLVWRAAVRCLCTAREYGVVEGILSVLRIPVANIIAIMAGRRALTAYFGTLRGRRVFWDKTAHSEHPALKGTGAGGDAIPAGSIAA